MAKYEHIHGDGEYSYEQKERELNELIEKYACGMDEKPRWYVYGKNYDGGFGILFWIRRGEEDEFIARRFASVINRLGGNAQALMYERTSSENKNELTQNQDLLNTP